MPANFLVPLVLALFVPAVFAASRWLGPGRGALASLIGGWLFLPVFDGRVDVPFLPTKMAFTSTVVLLVSLAVDLDRFRRIRFHPVDLAALMLTIVPFGTALSNGLGAYEGVSASVTAFCSWVAPYWVGRAYLGSPKGFRLFARWTVVGALVYVPLCLWEIRMSPQLHRQLYGYATFENFAFVVRFGGYRPTVFMQFGLMVGTFMATGTLVAYWLWRTRAVTHVARLRIGLCVAVLAVTTVIVKSTGAIILLVVGIAALEAIRASRRRWPLLVLALLPFAFAGARISGWTAEPIVRVAQWVGPDRAQSVAFRISQEELLLAKAAERPLMGWGRFGRSRVRDEDGKDISVTDSLWIILLGTTGLVGLISLALLLIVPTLLVLRGIPRRLLVHPAVAPAVAISMGTALWVIDSLLNAMASPLFLAACGAATTFAATRWPLPRRAAAPRPLPAVARVGTQPFAPPPRPPAVR